MHWKHGYIHMEHSSVSAFRIIMERRHMQFFTGWVANFNIWNIMKVQSVLFNDFLRRITTWKSHIWIKNTRNSMFEKTALSQGNWMIINRDVFIHYDSLKEWRCEFNILNAFDFLRYRDVVLINECYSHPFVLCFVNFNNTQNVISIWKTFASYTFVLFESEFWHVPIGTTDSVSIRKPYNYWPNFWKQHGVFLPLNRLLPFWRVVYNAWHNLTIE